MNKRFVSVMATIGYGLVALAVILAIVIGILLAINGIGKKDEAFSDLEVSTDLVSEEEGFYLNNGILQVSRYLDEENEYTGFKLSIKATADGSDGNYIDYSKQKINLSLTKSEKQKISNQETPLFFAVKNAQNEVELKTSIQVSVNEEFTLVLATDEVVHPYTEETKKCIRGGIAYLQAITADGLHKLGEAQKIEVDVPIEEVFMTASGYGKDGTYQDLTDVINNTAKYFENLVSAINEENKDSWDKEKTYQIGNTTTYYHYDREEETWKSVWDFDDVQAFIVGTKLDLNIKTFPENANTNLNMSKLRFIEYFEGIAPNTATLDSRTGEFNIISEATYQINGAVNVRIQRIFNNGVLSTDENDFVTAKMLIRIEKVEVESITIDDKFEEGIDAYVFEDLKLSAADLSNYSNLGVVVKSKHYVHGEDPSQKELSQLYLHLDVTNSKSDMLTNEKDIINSSDLTPDSRDTQNNNVCWSLTINRELIGDETIDLYISKDTILNKDNPNAKLTLNIKQNLPESASYIGQKTLSVEKYDKFYQYTVDGITDPVSDIFGEDVETVNLQEGFLKYSLANSEKDLTYTKWVFFADNWEEANKNDFGSEILNLSSSGQLQKSNNGGGIDYSQFIDPLGDGTIGITGYLVLTNKNGEPIDCFHNVIEVGDETSFIFKKDEYANTDSNKFVVVFSVNSSCVITVNEKLKYVYAFYNDQGEEDSLPKFSDNVKPGEKIIVPLEIGDTTKWICMIGNSCIALKNAFEESQIYNQGPNDNLINTTDDMLQASFRNGIEDKENGISIGESGDKKLRIVYLPVRIYCYKDDNFDIVVRNVYDENKEYGRFECLAKEVVVDEIDVEYDEDILSTRSVTYEDSTSEFPLLTVKTILEETTGNCKAKWYFKNYGEGEDQEFRLNPEIKCKLNIEPAHDYKELEPTYDIEAKYQIVVLNDRDLLDFSVNPNLTKTSEYFLAYYDEENELLQLVLKTGWTTVTNNIALVYSVRNLEGVPYVRTKIFLLDLSSCAQAIINSDKDTYSSSTIGFTADPDWTYNIGSGNPLNIIPSIDISTRVEYPAQKSGDILISELSDWKMTLTVGDNYTLNVLEGVNKVLGNDEEFFIIVKLFDDDNVAYEFKYTRKLTQSVYSKI